jgi:hypothetical protein
MSSSSPRSGQEVQYHSFSASQTPPIPASTLPRPFCNPSVLTPSCSSPWAFYQECRLYQLALFTCFP